MREFHFDPHKRTPIVKALIAGPKGPSQLRLVFDTGAAMTQFHETALNFVGYNSSMKIADAVVTGATENEERGYIVPVSRIYVLGVRFDNVLIAGYNLSRLARAGIDGLLGFDLIRTLHLEMDGPSGILKVF